MITDRPYNYTINVQRERTSKAQKVHDKKYGDEITQIEESRQQHEIVSNDNCDDRIEDFYEVFRNNKEFYNDHDNTTKENIQQHAKDSLDDFEDRNEVIENKVEEDRLQIQEHNLSGNLKHKEFKARIMDQYSVYSGVNPKDENDYLIMMQIVVLKMNTEKVPLKNISFSKIIKVLVKEGQMQLTNLKSFKDKESVMKHFRDMACKMKARIQQMVKEWNLAKTVDNRHCSPEHKEMFELYIADIATLENNFNKEHDEENDINEESSK